MADDYLINFTATGADGVKAAATEVGAAVGGVNEKAGEANDGFSNFSNSVVGFAGKAAILGAVLKTVSTGLEEIAETEKAEQALRKAGIAAEQTAKAMQAVDDIELFTGDKISAARLYGDVMNGKTRELKGYGITLSATATIEEKLQVIEQLRRRGIEQDAAKIGTLTGEWERFKRGLGNAIETGAGWIVNATGISGALGMVNEKVFGLTKAIPPLVANTKEAAVAFKGTAREVENLGAKAATTLTQIAALRKGLSGQAEDADAKIFDANLRRDVADGKITENEAKRQRAQAEFDRAEQARQSAANDAERIKALAGQQRPELDKITKESIETETRDNLQRQGVTDIQEIQKRVDEEVKKGLERKSAALRELEEAEIAANKELKDRAEKRRVAQAELEATLAEVARSESEAEMQAAIERDNRRKERDDADKRQAESKRKAAEDAEREQKKAADAAAKKAADEEKARQREDKEKGIRRDEKGRELDDQGRRKIKGATSAPPLEPLPNRKGTDNTDTAAEKLKDTTNAAGQKTAKELEQTAAAVNRNTAAVKAFAETTITAFNTTNSRVEELERRMQSNI